MTSLVDIALIDAGLSLRGLDPAWVETLAEDMAAAGQIEAIQVVQRGDRYLLVSGARRLAAAQALGWTEIRADIAAAEIYHDDAAVRIAAIRAEIVKGTLTALDRARYITAWRDLYQATHETRRRGRKPVSAGVAPNAGTTETAAPSVGYELSANSAPKLEAGLIDASDRFVATFSEVAQDALGISRRSVFLALKIGTGISLPVVRQIEFTWIARSQGELLALAAEPADRQARILELMLSDPPQADCVANAIAHLAGTRPQTIDPIQRIQNGFVKLPSEKRQAFYEMNATDILAWQVGRRAARKRAA